MKADFSGQRSLVILIMASLLVLLAAAPGFADSASVTIPVKHKFKGTEYKGRDVFSFKLTAESDEAPMPEDSDGRSKTVTIEAGERPDFGRITFTSPGIYYYVVSRVRENHNRIREDNSRYRVMIAVLSDMSTEISFIRIGGDSVQNSSDQEEGRKVEEIVYTDKYEATPKTGDNALAAVFLVSVGLLCSGILFLMIAARRREDADDKRI